MPTATGTAGVAQRELAAIEVDLIPDRPGQVLRQALQERLELGNDGVAHRYDLTVGILDSRRGHWQSSGYHRDTHSPDRQRELDAGRRRIRAHADVTSGFAKAVDAVNIIDEQYFAADLSNEAIQKRLAEAMADQITLQLAIFFRRRAAANSLTTA